MGIYTLEIRWGAVYLFSEEGTDGVFTSRLCIDREWGREGYSCCAVGVYFVGGMEEGISRGG